jgi:hypothetical protein
MLQSSEFLYLEREVHMASIWRSGIRRGCRLQARSG